MVLFILCKRGRHFLEDVEGRGIVEERDGCVVVHDGQWRVQVSSHAGPQHLHIPGITSIVSLMVYRGKL